MMKRALVLFITFLLILSACQPATPQYVTPVPVPLGSTSIPETNGQSLPAGETAKEMALPVSAGTPVPWPTQAITLANASQVEPLARWGKGTISDVHWSPDGKRIALASSLGIYVYDAITLQETRFMATSSGVGAFDYSADGTMLSSGSGSDGDIVLWDVASGKELRRLVGHNNFIVGLKFSPTGDTLASAAYREAIKIWDVASGRELLTLDMPQREVGYDFDFSPDGKLLASGYGSDVMALWDVSSGKVLRKVDGGFDVGNFLEFSPDGNTVAFASEGKTIKLWDIKNSKDLVTLTESSWINGLAFLPDGKTLASKVDEEPIKLWDTATGQMLRTLPGTESDFNMSFSPDGKRALTESHDDGIHFWDVESWEELPGFIQSSAIITGLAFSPDGKRIAFQDLNQKIHLWDAADGQEMRTLVLSTTPAYTSIHGLVFSPDGALLASGSTQGTIKLWEASNGRELQTLKGPRSDTEATAKYWTTGLVFSPDGTVIAAGFGDNTIKVWDVASGAELRTIGDPKYCYGPCLESLAFSPGEELLAAGYDDGAIILWEASTGRAMRTIEAHQSSMSNEPIKGLAFSPDGSILASGATDKTIKLWDVSSGQELRTLTGHTDEVTSLAFSTDGKLLFSGSADTTIKVWDIAGGKEIKSLALQNGWVTDVSISADGRVLASSSDDGTVALWGIPPWLPVEPEPDTQPEAGSASLLPTPNPTQQPTLEDIGVERTTIPILAAAANIQLDKWSLDSSFLSYIQWGRIDASNADQGAVSLLFLKASTGEVCPGVQENAKFLSGWGGVYPAGISVDRRTAWLPDNRLLYVSLDSKLQVITPCKSAVEDWSSSVAGRVVSVANNYSTKQDASQIILIGEKAYWLFTPGTRRAVQLDLPLPVPLNEYDMGREAYFEGSPWDEKVVVTNVEKRQGKFWIVVDSINTLAGKVSRIIEVEGSQEVEMQSPFGASIEWLSKTKLLLENTEMGKAIIDMSRQPPQVVPLFPDLTGMAAPSTGTQFMWGGEPGSGGEDYHYIWAMMPESGGQLYLYHGESGLVDEFSPQPGTLLIFPNGELEYTQPFMNPPSGGPIIFRVVYVDTDAKSPDLVLKGHVLPPDDWWWVDARLLPESQKIMFSSSQGSSLLDLISGTTLGYWEVADKEQYPGPYFLPSPDGKTLVAYARHEDPEGKASMDVIFWQRLEP